MKKLFLSLLLLTLSAPIFAANQTSEFNINQTVLKLEIEEDISIDEAIESMKLRANSHNMMFVAHQPLHEQLKTMGVKSKRLEIFQFCDPRLARKMVDHNPIFAAYMPCRIALVEEPDGKSYLMMLKLDILIDGATLPPVLHKMAVELNDKLVDVLQAGASGDL